MEAYIIKRRLQADTGAKERMQNYGNAEYYLGQLETAVTAKLTPDTTISLVGQTLGLTITSPEAQTLKEPEETSATTKAKSKRAELKLDQEQIDSMLMLELTSSNPLSYKLDFPLAALVEGISKSKKSKAKFEGMVKDFDTSKLTTPKQWTWAFLVAKSFGNQEKASQCVDLVAKWLPTAPEFKADGTALPDELSLTSIAKQLEIDGPNNDLAIRILERAESIATQINKPNLRDRCVANWLRELAKPTPKNARAF